MKQIGVEVHYKNGDKEKFDYVNECSWGDNVITLSITGEEITESGRRADFQHDLIDIDKNEVLNVRSLFDKEFGY